MKTRAGFFVHCLALILLIAGCKSLKPGECNRDADCEDQVKGVPACYKEPANAEIGKCMTVKEAKAALEDFKRRSSGTCEDKDGDQFKAGNGCDRKEQLDCDDNDPQTKPGAAEVCDAKDNNCDGVINEGVKECVGTVMGGKQEPIVKSMTTMTSGVKVAPNGEVWVSDQHQIYRIDAKGDVIRVAGGNEPGKDDKKGKFAKFDEPRSMAVAADGTVYLTECKNNCIRKIDPDTSVSAYVGLCSSEADDTGLDKEGAGNEARFWCPIDITFDADGSLLVVDMYNSKVKRITKDRKVVTVAGRGGKEGPEGVEFGYSDGAALKAEFNRPGGVALGPDGTIYIADTRNNCIRTLKKDRVETFAGACGAGKDNPGHKDGPARQAKFNQPNSVDVAPDGTVFVADTMNHCIRKIKDGNVSTVSGTLGQQGYFDGPVPKALFNGPMTLSLAKDGSIYVVDFGNYRVRHIVF